MVGPVIGLAIVTSAIGLLVCVLAYLEFLRLKSKPKPRHETNLQSDPMISAS
jgi:biopolymer transport protein ExbB/TolQ